MTLFEQSPLQQNVVSISNQYNFYLYLVCTICLRGLVWIFVPKINRLISYNTKSKINIHFYTNTRTRGGDCCYTITSLK